jgi:flagellar basal body-associated protein FliL
MRHIGRLKKTHNFISIYRIMDLLTLSALAARIVMRKKETFALQVTVPTTGTPAATTPAATTPAATTPAATTPAATTPAATTPAVTTPAATTPAVTTPAATTPAVTTPAATVTITTGGTPQIATTPTPQKMASWSIVLIVIWVLFTLGFGIYAAYLSWSCNSLTNMNVFGKCFFAFFAFLWGFSYLISYVFMRWRDCAYIRENIPRQSAAVASARGSPMVEGTDRYSITPSAARGGRRARPRRR